MKLGISTLILFLSFCISLEAQIGRLPLSPLQKMEQNIGVTDITLVFSRPSMRGRKIFGGLVPFNKLWRTGANRNTTIQFSRDVVINQKRVKEGKYAIFSIPNPKQWEIIFYKDTDNWNVPATLDSTKIAATIMVDAKRLNTSKEVFTLSVGDFTNYKFDLDIAWDKTAVSIPIDLITKEYMDAKLKDQLSGPDYNDYYAAAEYQMESGKEFQKGLEWINKAIKITDKVTWWDLRIQAILLMELGRDDEAIKVANEGLEMAKKAKREYGINEFNKVLNKLDK